MKSNSYRNSRIKSVYVEPNVNFHKSEKYFFLIHTKFDFHENVHSVFSIQILLADGLSVGYYFSFFSHRSECPGLGINEMGVLFVCRKPFGNSRP